MSSYTATSCAKIACSSPRTSSFSRISSPATTFSFTKYNTQKILHFKRHLGQDYGVTELNNMIS